MRIQIDEAKRCFTRGGQPFFYQADTLWMAFSKLSLAEWEEILRLRRQQRYTVLQISVLPIVHDNSDDEQAMTPFPRAEGGGWDFDGWNDEYFSVACAMLEKAVEYGFVPCLHLLWANYVPDTWAAKLVPGAAMPAGAREKYLRRFLPMVKRFEPIYSISGDTGFETQRVTDCYLEAMRIVREIDPEGLITLHLQPHADVPGELSESGMLDFYTYQAGHGHKREDQLNSVNFAQQYWKRPGNKPVVNTEPPYEGHGYGHEYGRFKAFHIRKAMWQSLLSGAQAGITYGAHGLWSMHREGQRFNNVKFSGYPFDWRTSLRLDGAWESGYAQMLYAQYDLFDISPMDCVQTHPEAIRMAGKRDGSVLLLYAPYPTDIVVDTALSDYDIVALDLEHKRYMRAETAEEDGKIRLILPQVNADILYIAKRRV